MVPIARTGLLALVALFLLPSASAISLDAGGIARVGVLEDHAACADVSDPLGAASLSACADADPSGVSASASGSAAGVAASAQSSAGLDGAQAEASADAGPAHVSADAGADTQNIFQKIGSWISSLF